MSIKTYNFLFSINGSFVGRSIENEIKFIFLLLALLGTATPALAHNFEVDGIYYKKAEPIAEALKKRLKISRMIYSPMGSFFIKQGLHNDAAIEKIKRIFC